MTDSTVPPGHTLPGISQDEVQAAVQVLLHKYLLADVTINPNASAGSADLQAPRPLAFTIMPFGPEDLQHVYKHIVKETLSRCGCDCIRGDDMFGSDVVMEEVIKAITTADLIIADLTGQNANVFYEVGIAHTLGKPVLLLSQKLQDIPFNLRHRRILTYEYSLPGGYVLAERLEAHVRAMLEHMGNPSG